MKTQIINQDLQTSITNIINKYENVILDDFMMGYDAPTKTGEEVEIILYKRETSSQNAFMKDCYRIRRELDLKYVNEVTSDIEKDNAFAFIYIIL